MIYVMGTMLARYRVVVAVNIVYIYVCVRACIYDGTRNEGGRGGGEEKGRRKSDLSICIQ